MTTGGLTAVPPRTFVWDTETDGLIPELTTIHCLVTKEIGGESRTYSNGPLAVGTVEQGVRFLLDEAAAGSILVAHNSIGFDEPAVQKLYPWFTPPPAQLIDTLVLGRLVYPDLRDVDTKLMASGTLPGKLYKSHSLAAWGARLKCAKGDYEGDPSIANEDDRKLLKWSSWNQSMEDYCVQDVVVLEKLYLKLVASNPSPQSQALEQSVARIIRRQEETGFTFDKAGAVKLYSALVKAKLEAEAEVLTAFHPRYFKDGQPTVAKRDNKTLGYTSGCEYQKVKLVDFNPGSRDHIATWLKALYGWAPTEFTTEGKPKVDEEVLLTLPYPEAKVFSKYLIIAKRLGQIAEGKEAWLRHERGGKIHGRVNTNGAVTGRATHSKPNLGQVPAVYSPYGKECRALFGPSAGKVQVGADMSGIELRCLAHYMARFDGGEYGRIVTEGDIHKANQEAAGLPTRDMAKTFVYAFL